MDNVLIRFKNLKEKNSLKAIHLIKVAISKDPNNFAYLEALGKHLCRIEEDKMGVQYLQKAQAISELEASSTFVLALSLMKTDKYQAAIDQFKKVKAVYPEAYYNSAICYVRLNKFQKAMEEARNIINDSYLGKEAFKIVIDISSLTNDLTTVEAELEDYKNKFGEDDYYHHNLATKFYRAGIWLECIFHYAKINPNEIDRFLYNDQYAFALTKTGQYKRALEIYEEIINSRPLHEHIIFEYLEVLNKLGRYQEILDALNEHKSVIRNKAKHKEVSSRAYYNLNLK